MNAPRLEAEGFGDCRLEDDSIPIVMPAKAGIQNIRPVHPQLDSRFRGNDVFIGFLSTLRDVENLLFA